MIKPDKLIADGPIAYALFTGGGSFIAAAAQRATREGAHHDKSMRQASDMARWEGEGGAAMPRTRAAISLPKLLPRQGGRK